MLLFSVGAIFVIVNALKLGADLIKLAVTLVPVLLVLVAVGFVLQKLGCGSKPQPPEAVAQVEQTQTTDEENGGCPWTKNQIEKYRITEQSIGREFSDYSPKYITAIEGHNYCVDLLLEKVQNWNWKTDKEKNEFKKYMDHREKLYLELMKTLKEYQPSPVKTPTPSPTTPTKPNRWQVIPPK